MPSLFLRLPRLPCLAAVLLALTCALDFALPDYAFALDHAPTAFVCMDTSKAISVEAPVPMAIVLARNRDIAGERVDQPLPMLVSSATDRERSSESGSSNPLKRYLN